MNQDIQSYNNSQATSDKSICDLLSKTIMDSLPESENKMWHGHPVWFLEGNPIVGYFKLKDSVQSFKEVGLQDEGTFKASQKRYTSVDQVDVKRLQRWLKKAKEIQWDYKNIVKLKGELVRLK